MSFLLLLQFQKELQELAANNIKVVVLTSRSEAENEDFFPERTKGIKVYMTSDKKKQIGIITDSQYVLTAAAKKTSKDKLSFLRFPAYCEFYRRYFHRKQW